MIRWFGTGPMHTAPRHGRPLLDKIRDHLAAAKIRYPLGANVFNTVIDEANFVIKNFHGPKRSFKQRQFNSKVLKAIRRRRAEWDVWLDESASTADRLEAERLLIYSCLSKKMAECGLRHSRRARAENEIRDRLCELREMSAIELLPLLCGL